MSSGIDIVVETTLTAALTRIHPVLGHLTGIPLVVFLFVSVLTVAYVGFYLFQGVRVWFELQWAVHRLSRLKRAKTAVSREHVASILHRQPFRHLWDEYADTLHELRKPGDGALTRETRATVPAEMFFTRDVLVDSRLWDDFFRHLPGVLTGLGIIGTFAGHLSGLKDFDHTTGAAAVAALKPLLGAVSNAFLASAIAIACAMFVVFTSRLTLAACYRKVEQLDHAIDSLYSTGAGEEYLSRLVQSSEKSEAHSAHLKYALLEVTKALSTLEEAINRSAASQQVMTEQMRSFIHEFRNLSAAARQTGAAARSESAEAVRRN